MAKEKSSPDAKPVKNTWFVSATRWRDPGDQAYIGKVLIDEDATTREAATERAKELLDELAPVVDKKSWITVDIQFHPAGAPASEVEFGTFVPTQAAIDAAIEIGMVGDVVEQIMTMAEHGAICKQTHPWATHRHGRFVMVLDGNKVTRFDVMGPPPPPPPKRRQHRQH